MKMMICLVGHRGYSALSSRIIEDDGDDNYNVTVFFNLSVDRTYAVFGSMVLRK